MKGRKKVKRMMVNGVWRPEKKLNDRWSMIKLIWSYEGQRKSYTMMTNSNIHKVLRIDKVNCNEEQAGKCRHTRRNSKCLFPISIQILLLCKFLWLYVIWLCYGGSMFTASMMDKLIWKKISSIKTGRLKRKVSFIAKLIWNKFNSIKSESWYIYSKDETDQIYIE